MKKMPRFIELLSFTILVLINYGCKKDSINDNYYVKTGIVTDQVTGKPVSGASVQYGYRRFGEFDVPVGTIGEPALSGADGRYSISVLKSISGKIDPVGQQVYKEQLLYATCDGYAGSNIISSAGGQIVMYHPAEVYLHVKNDTLNNKINVTRLWIQGVDYSLWGYPGFIGCVTQNMYAGYSKICGGKLFDSIFVVKQLWGNLDYYVKGAPDIFMGPEHFKYILTPAPDSIIHFDVIF
jgi:hypothetical protein